MIAAMRHALTSVLISVLLFASCARLTPASGVAPVSPDLEKAATVASPSPTATPSYSPGPASTSGTVVRRSAVGVVLDQAGTEIDVDLRSVVDVWRETSVAASAIEIGDDLMVNGTHGPTAFIARYVYANIGRLDGEIRAFDGHELLLATHRAGVARGEVRVELSRYVEIVDLGPAGQRPAGPADLALGREVGMVTYRPRGGVRRAARIWLSPAPSPSASAAPDRVLGRPVLDFLERSPAPTLVNADPGAGTFSMPMAGSWRYDARVRTLYPVARAARESEHFSPAGRLIAVERMRTTPGGYLIAKELAIREQGVERVLYRSSGDGFYWSGWSPDGRYVALWEVGSYSGSVDMDGRPLVVVNVQTEAHTDLGTTLLYGTTAWTAPHTLAYVAGGSRLVWDTKTLRLWSPERGVRDVTTPGRAAFAPAWSADGRSLYFVSGPAGQWDPVTAVAGAGVGDRRIEVYDISTGAVRALPHEPGREEEGVRPSRDGTRLLVLRRTTGLAPDVRSIPSVDLEVWLTDTSGGHGSLLVRFPGGGLSAYGYLTGPGEWDWSE